MRRGWEIRERSFHDSASDGEVYRAVADREARSQASRSSDFNNPILVDTKAGIIAGHGRLLAARKLGLTEVPVIVLDHLSEAQKRAYIIADNQLALNADWDYETLRAELSV